MSGPLDGAPDAPVVGHPLCHFVPHSSCSEWLWPNWRVSHSNPELWQTPTTIVGSILDMVVVSHDVEGASYEELGNM
jgi:hypothetical protein